VARKQRASGGGLGGRLSLARLSYVRTPQLGAGNEHEMRARRGKLGRTSAPRSFSQYELRDRPISRTSPSRISWKFSAAPVQHL
jgi:hypothetical protein